MPIHGMRGGHPRHGHRPAAGRIRCGPHRARGHRPDVGAAHRADRQPWRDVGHRAAQTLGDRRRASGRDRLAAKPRHTRRPGSRLHPCHERERAPCGPGPRLRHHVRAPARVRSHRGRPRARPVGAKRTQRRAERGGSGGHRRRRAHHGCGASDQRRSRRVLGAEALRGLAGLGQGRPPFQRAVRIRTAAAQGHPRAAAGRDGPGRDHRDRRRVR